MDRETIHATILDALLGLQAGGKASAIRIVARLYNDELLGGDDVSPVFLFVPDMHWMSRAGDAKYRYGFARLDGAWRIDRTAMLTAVLDAMKQVRTTVDAELGDGTFRVVQLGDFLDLWREDERQHEGVEALASRIVGDNALAWQQLLDLDVEVVVGNHDDQGPASASLRSARLARPYKVGDSRSLLVTHGHLYDPVEQSLAASLHLNEWFVERFGPLAGAKSYLVDRTAGGQTPEPGGSEGASPRVLHQASDAAGLPDWVNVWLTIAPRDDGLLAASHELLPHALEFAAGLRAGGKKVLAKAGLKSALPDLRTIVMGHSHFPRICIHRDASDRARDLVLMDCGAWIENSQFGDDLQPSCHLGVLCGGDARIYQIDPHANLVQPWS